MVPHFDFNDLIYLHTSALNLIKLQTIQNNALRMVLRENRMSHVLEMHLRLNVDTLAERRVYHLSCFVYKVVNNLIKDVRLTSLFEKMDIIHDRGTRAITRGDLVIRDTRTRFGEFAIQVFGSRAWNVLPIHVRLSKSLNIFVNAYLRLSPT